MKRFLWRPLVAFLSRHPRLAVALLAVYFISPFDIFPEGFSGLIGYLDDLIIVTGVLLIQHHLSRTRERPDKKPKVIDTTAEVLHEDKETERKK